MAAAPQVKEGERFGNWALCDPIGRGAHATVYRAKHTIDGREAAVKVLDLKNAVEDSREAFFRELAVMERFSTKGTPRFYGSVENVNTLGIVMQMARGGDLLDYLNSDGTQSEPVCAAIFSQVFRTIEAAHKCGICHRDIKLENLLLDGDSVLLCDWGFAAFAHPGELLTKPCGTIGYCAPEITSGEAYCGTAADYYSLGVVLYALLTGSMPPHGYETPKNVSLSLEVRELLAGLLHLEPAQRWGARQVKACRWWKLHCEGGSPISRAVKGMLRRLSA